MFKISEGVGRSIYAIKITNGKGTGSVWNSDVKKEIEISVGLTGSPEIMALISENDGRNVLVKAIPSEDGQTLTVEQLAAPGEAIPFTSSKGKNKFAFIAKIINYKETYKTVVNADGTRSQTSERNGGFLSFANVKYGDGFLSAGQPTTGEYVNPHTGVTTQTTTYWLGCKVNVPSEMSTACNTFIVEQPERFNKGDFVVSVINVSQGKDGKTYFNMEKIFEESRIGIVYVQPSVQPAQTIAQPSQAIPPANNVPTQPIAQPVVQPVVQPIAQPVVQPIVQPVAQPVVQPVVQPVAQPVVQPIAQPVVQPIAQPDVQPTTEPLENQLPFGNNGTLPFN